MNDNYITERLSLEKLQRGDEAFVMELVNTPEWIQFIGNRNIHSMEDAGAYIQKIMNNPAINYWVVRLIDKKIPVGIISFIRRDYLPHHDIGFAFLNAHKRKGYAYEAASIILQDALKDPSHTQILATTVKANSKSIQLLQKLGFSFHKEIMHEHERLLVFEKSAIQ